MIMLDPSPQFGEIKGGRDIYPIYHHEKCVGGAPIWEVEDEGDVKVYAAPMSHGVSLIYLSNIWVKAMTDFSSGVIRSLALDMLLKK